MGLGEWGERFKREGAYGYLWLNHDVVWPKPTQHCKAVILNLAEFSSGDGDQSKSRLCLKGPPFTQGENPRKSVVPCGLTVPKGQAFSPVCVEPIESIQRG